MAGEFWFAAVDFPIGGGEPKMIILSKGGLAIQDLWSPYLTGDTTGCK